LHAVGELSSHGVLFVDGAGGDAKANGPEEGFFVPGFDVKESREGEVSPVFGVHGASVAHAHVVFDVVGHEHEGQVVGGGVHGSEHVHFHVHVGGVHGVGRGAFWNAIHFHEHVAIGGHPVAFGVLVICHDADRSVAIGAGGGPVCGGFGKAETEVCEEEGG